MAEFGVDLVITIDTALAVGGAGSVGTLADKSLLRDGWNRPVLPASQIKGRLRHTCEAILRGLGVLVCQAPSPDTMCPHHSDIAMGPDGKRRCHVCQIFGSPDYPSQLRFRDLVYSPVTGDPVNAGHLYQPHEPLRPGVGLERCRGTVKEALLFLTETTAPGTQPSFARDRAILGDLADKGQAALVLMGLNQILNWGGGKSRGMGWAQIEYQAYWSGSPFTLDDTAGREALAKWMA